MTDDVDDDDDDNVDDENENGDKDSRLFARAFAPKHMTTLAYYQRQHSPKMLCHYNGLRCF